MKKICIQSNLLQSISYCSVLTISLLMVPNVITKLFGHEHLWVIAQYLFAALSIVLGLLNGIKFDFLSKKILPLHLFGLLIVTLTIISSAHSISLKSFSNLVKFFPIYCLAILNVRLFIHTVEMCWGFLALLISLSSFLMAILFLQGATLFQLDFAAFPLDSIGYLGATARSTFFHTADILKMRLQGWAWEPAAHAYFLIPAFFYFCTKYSQKNGHSRVKRLFFIFSALILAASLFSTKSLGALVSILVTFFLFTIIRKRNMGIKIFISALVIAGGVIALPFILLWANAETSLPIRWEVFLIALAAWSNDPMLILFGAGYLNDESISPLLTGQTNSLIRSFSYFGLPFSIFWYSLILGFVGLAFKSKLHQKHDYLRYSLVCLCIFNISLDLSYSPPFFLILTCISIASYLKKSDLSFEHVS